LIALALFVAARLASAQTPSGWALRAWQSDDGLPNNQVTGIAQTPDGYLWVATYAAPARFDGVHFEEYLPADLGLGTDQKITTVAVGRKGEVYLGTMRGAVVRLDGHGIRRFDTGMPYKPVQTIVEDGDGTVWLSHQGGSITRLTGDRATVLTQSAGVPPPDTPTRYGCALTTDAQGRLWFAKNGRIGVFQAGHLETLLRMAPTSTALAPAANGGIWICAGSQLYRVAAEGPAKNRASLPLPDGTEVTAALEDHLGGVWIGTADAGLYRFDGHQVERVGTSDARITCLYEDRKSNLWVGTAGGGLNRIRSRIVTLENSATGLPSGIIQSITQDAAGTMWATTPNGLLLRRDGERWTTVSDQPDWPGGRAAAVAAGPDHAVWIGTRERMLHRWQDGAFTSWGRTDGLAGREVRALHVGRNGDVWLALSTPDIVQRLRQGVWKSFAMPEGVRVLRAIAEDTAGDIWIGTSRGMLLRIHGEQVEDLTPATTGEPLSIRCVTATPEGGIWIGYADESVGWWKGGQYRHVTTREGFPERNVSQILRDDAGWLWFAGDHGLFKVRQNALEALALGQASAAHFVRYGESEGLFSIEANFGEAPGATRSRDGRLWIPLRTALAIVDPSRTREDPIPPRVVLKRIVVDDKVVAAYGGTVPVRDAIDLHDPASALRLAPGHRRLQFEYAALSFGAPENVRFRYRLDGSDSDWVDAGAQRLATYSRLPAGTYRFDVLACNGDGVWSTVPTSIGVTVAPFAWQTWWFRIGALLAFTSATAVIARQVSLRRLRTRLRQLEQQAAVDRERARIARDLHDDFGTRLTELGLLVELRRQALPDDATEMIRSLRSLERDLDTIVWTVNPKNDSLGHLIDFISRVSAEFLDRAGIRCRLDIPDELPMRMLSPELRHNVFFVVREALNNIAKHAHATCVRIAVKVDADRLEIRVENDGHGFNVEQAEAGERNGLKNMRARIDELGGEFDLQSSATGTTVKLRVPLSATAPAGAHRHRAHERNSR
jgi:signal transduction histidine kinase/ligand-binding sensor domain-containing protein